MERFLSFHYYFTTRPNPDFQYTKLTIAIIVILFLGSLAISIYRRKFLKDDIWKKIIRNHPKILRNHAIILMILLVVRETGIPFLSMRIIWALFFLSMLYFFIKFLITAKREYARRIEKLKGYLEKNKYLPKKKRK